MLNRLTWLLASFLFCTFSVQAQDTLHVGDKLDTHLLQEGTKSYVHYKVLKDGRKMARSMKEITLAQEGSTYRVIQKEFMGKNIKQLETVVDAQTLNTDTHIRTSGKKRQSYQFSKASVSGIPGDKESINRDFEIALSEPTMNFEIDFVVLQSIDWNKHESIVMNFYHPEGRTPPAFYTFEREKSERLELASGTVVDTWVVLTDYNGQPPARFWISKEDNEIIKQETDAMDMAGFTFVKRLISPSKK